MPPLAFLTPKPSPDLVLLRRTERSANEPPLLKRKRTSPSSCGSAIDADVYASDPPNDINLPYWDCESFGNSSGEGAHGASATSLPLPNITLYPRTKRSRIGCFGSPAVFPQEQQDDRDRSNYEPEPRRKRVVVNTIPSSTGLQRTASSKSILPRRPSMNLTRSLSLQFNLSFLNLAAAATGSSTSCPNSASTSSLMAQRSSFQDVQNLAVHENKEANHRRSPVSTTLEYFATAMRFPDVAIGLSI